MKTQYNIVATDSGRTETLELANVQFVTDVIEEEHKEGHFFFNVVLGSGTAASILSEDKDVLMGRRNKVLKARRKFMKAFYKKMAVLNAKAIRDPKADKKRKKNIKRELKLLKQIRDALYIPISDL